MRLEWEEGRREEDKRGDRGGEERRGLERRGEDGSSSDILFFSPMNHRFKKERSNLFKNVAHAK